MAPLVSWGYEIQRPSTPLRDRPFAERSRSAALVKRGPDIRGPFLLSGRSKEISPFGDDQYREIAVISAAVKLSESMPPVPAAMAPWISATELLRLLDSRVTEIS